MDADLQACIDGDKVAWNAFVDRYAPTIHAVVRRTLGRTASRSGSGEIDDVVQEVFIRLIRRESRLLRTFDPARASLNTWLAVVARSVAIDCVRRSTPDTVPLQDQDRPEPAPEAEIDHPDIPFQVLSPRQRLVLRLLFDEDMSVEQAAGVLDVSAQTVRSTKHKALSRLREVLATSEDSATPRGCPAPDDP